MTFAYQTGGDGVEVRVQDGTVWLSQKLIARLFDTSAENIIMHIKNIIAETEIDAVATTKDFLVVQNEGSRTVNRNIKHYNLDMIIAVGYRVNSEKATEFRRWATVVLREFALRGYLIDKKRMENGMFLDDDYFERLLEEIREIRLSERRFYQKVTDIYATAMDYDKKAKTTQNFFAKVQNKLHLAEQLDLVLKASKYEILDNLGKISAQIAKAHAENEFEKYRVIQDKLFKSDYDEFLSLEDEGSSI